MPISNMFYPLKYLIKNTTASQFSQYPAFKPLWFYNFIGKFNRSQQKNRITGLVKRSQIARVCVNALENPAMKNRIFEVVALEAVKKGREQFIIEL